MKTIDIKQTPTGPDVSKHEKKETEILGLSNSQE